MLFLNCERVNRNWLVENICDHGFWSRGIGFSSYICFYRQRKGKEIGDKTIFLLKDRKDFKDIYLAGIVSVECFYKGLSFLSEVQ